jgi:hypothetical protein
MISSSGEHLPEPAGHPHNIATSADLAGALAQEGYAFVRGADMRRMLTELASLSDWDAFAASWNGMALDTFMNDGGRYRRRRYAVYDVDRDGSIARQPHQPHYQSTHNNRLNGGVDRWFEPVAEETGAGPSMTTLLRFCAQTFGAQALTTRAWHVEVHQFRIEARSGEPGSPTPEGMHRDGVDHVLVLLVGRKNVARGTTTIADADRRNLGSFTLSEPLDAALVDDHRVYHGVTPIEPFDPESPAYRDVLVITFRAKA